MKLRTCLILTIISGLVVSCGKKSGNTGLLVPEDAAIVVHINSASLSSKISWEEIRQTNWFKDMSREATDTLAQQLLADPGRSGIDTKADLVFYMKKRGRGGYIVFEGTLSDAAAYEKMLKEATRKEPGETGKEGDFNYLTTDESSIVLWNASMFAIIADAPQTGMSNRIFKDNESPVYHFSIDSLKYFGKEALSLKKSDNLDNDSRFAELVKDGGDIHLWVNSELYSANAGAMLSMMKLGDVLKDNVSATTLNFENGKMTARSKTYYGKEMQALLEKFPPAPVSRDLVNRIPSSDVLGLLAFNYPPEGLLEFLKMIGADGMANAALAEVDYTMEEFIKANKGEVLLAVSDFKMVSKTDTLDFGYGSEPSITTKNKPDVKVLFATSVNDRQAFEKLVDIGKKMTPPGEKELAGLSYKLRDNWFVAGNSAEQVERFFAGNKTSLSFADKITGSPVGFYLDLQKLIRSAGQSEKMDSSAKAALEATAAMWESIIAKGGEYKDNAMQFSVEVNLSDKQTNSLKLLNQYIGKIYSLRKRPGGIESIPERILTDTLITLPAD